MGRLPLDGRAPRRLAQVGGAHLSWGDDYRTREKFLAGYHAADKQLEDDKANVKGLTRCRRYVKARAERQVQREQALFSAVNGEDGLGFPPPMDGRGYDRATYCDRQPRLWPGSSAALSGRSRVETSRVSAVAKTAWTAAVRLCTFGRV